LGSGEGNSIKELVELVIKHSGKDIDVKWLTDVPSGDKKRLMSMNKMNKYGFKSHTSLEEGVKKTTEWFLNNKDILDKRYNPFVNH
jgi:GDP-L-fucose synthase